jgi:hypothetical protein
MILFAGKLNELALVKPGAIKLPLGVLRVIALAVEL